MWDLTGPPDAEPMVLGRGAASRRSRAVVRANRAMAGRRRSEWRDVLACYAGVGPRSCRVSAGTGREMWHSIRTGSGLLPSAGRGGVEIWPSTVNGFPRRHIAADVSQLAVSPDGQFLATGTRSGSVLVLPVAGPGFRELRGFQGWVDAVAFDATGRRIAADGPMDGGRSHVIRVFDLQTGDVKSFDPGDGKDIVSVAFLPDGGLLVSSFGGLRRLDVETGSFELLLAQPGMAFLGPDGRHLLLLRSAE